MMGSSVIETGEVEKILGVIMAQKYNLKIAYGYFGDKG